MILPTWASVYSEKPGVDLGHAAEESFFVIGK